MSEGICRASGKQRHRSVRAAKVNAKLFAQNCIKQRRIVHDMYAYECGRCDSWHLTRMSEFDGKPLTCVFIAAPADMQRWAWGS